MESIIQAVRDVSITSNLAKTPESGSLLHLSYPFRIFDSLPTDDLDIVFVCLDCEAFEYAQHKVTEIGIAVLDTRDLRGLSATAGDDAITGHIRSAHYRLVEYSGLVNRKFVHGCPTTFNFGSSTWVKLADVPRLINRILRDPTNLEHCARFDIEMIDAEPQIVLVGHGLGNDIKYLQTLGIKISTVPSIINQADTQKLAPLSRLVGLATLLVAVGIKAVNLHNAGNDAVHTEMIALESREPEKLGKILSKPRRKPLDLHDHRIHAPVLWGGSAKCGDEARPRTGHGRVRGKNAGGDVEGPTNGGRAALIMTHVEASKKQFLVQVKSGLRNAQSGLGDEGQNGHVWYLSRCDQNSNSTAVS
ncbi:hypothetical protein LTR74_018264 [Friedmanniomyces endolithicus]|nr:hypothetical protein LTR74_018264 [Friedmanniomyces endolithicus]